MSPVPADKKFKYIKNHMLTLIHARYCPNPPGTCKGFDFNLNIRFQFKHTKLTVASHFLTVS